MCVFFCHTKLGFVCLFLQHNSSSCPLAECFLDRKAKRRRINEQSGIGQLALATQSHASDKVISLFATVAVMCAIPVAHREVLLPSEFVS